MDVHEVASSVQMAAHPEAEIIFGAVIDEQMGDAMRVTVIATGYEDTELQDVSKVSPALTRRIELPERDTVGAVPPEYEVHEKYNPEALARWQAFSKRTGTDGERAMPEPVNERTLEVPTFFRRRWPRRP
jgi:cell division protein FtsZ